MEIEIIRVEIGEYGSFLDVYDDPVIPLTKEQEEDIEEVVKKAVKEFENFCYDKKRNLNR